MSDPYLSVLPYHEEGGQTDDTWMLPTSSTPRQHWSGTFVAKRIPKIKIDNFLQPPPASSPLTCVRRRAGLRPCRSRRRRRPGRAGSRSRTPAPRGWCWCRPRSPGTPAAWRSCGGGGAEGEQQKIINEANSQIVICLINRTFRNWGGEKQPCYFWTSFANYHMVKRRALAFSRQDKGFCHLLTWRIFWTSSALESYPQTHTHINIDA